MSYQDTVDHAWRQRELRLKSTGREYPCPYCDRASHLKDWVAPHIGRMHPDAKPAEETPAPKVAQIPVRNQPVRSARAERRKNRRR